MSTHHGSYRSERSRPTARLSYSFLTAALALAILASALPAAAQQVQVKAVAETADILLGKSFFFQIQVLGGNDVGKPDLAALRDFDIRELSLSWVINRAADRLKKFDLQNGTTYLYRLVALRPGPQSIPPVTVEVDDAVYTTQPLPVRVAVPPPSEDFKLSLSLSKKRAYVGEPVVLRGLWMARLSARFFSYIIPILRDPAFDPDGASAGAGSYYRGASSWVQSLDGEEGTALINGSVYKTVRFEKVLMAQAPGNFEFPPATVQIFGVGDDDNTPQQGGRWNLNSAVIAAQALRIQVLPLPAAGRPANFSGLVADNLQVKASVAPSEMNVGDPVTITITLSGPPLLENAGLPALDSIAGLAGRFTFRPDSLKAQLGEREKAFNLTIRVTGEEVREIPSLEIPYFNTRSGSYQVARTNPVPLTVRPTRILTSADLEARSSPASSSQAAVRPWGEGILFNYSVSDRLLANQPGPGIGYLARHPAIPVLLGAPLAALLSALIFRQRQTARRKLALAAAASRQEVATPYQQLQQKLEGGSAEILAAWREYLGARLGLQPGQLAWQDVEAEFQSRGIGGKMLDELRAIHSRFELENYAGAQEEEPPAERSLAARIGKIALELERWFS